MSGQQDGAPQPGHVGLSHRLFQYGCYAYFAIPTSVEANMEADIHRYTPTDGSLLWYLDPHQPRINLGIIDTHRSTDRS